MEVFFKNLTPEEGTADRLLYDLNALDENTQELFLVSQGNIAEKTKEKFTRGLERLKATCRAIQEQDESTFAAAGSEQAYPYITLSIVFGLGILIGSIVKHSPR